MPAPEIIRQLVEKFKENYTAYRSDKYNEAQLRQEFVDKFFEALGWDVYNKNGVAPDYRDVVVEDSLEIDGGSKAPDYAFKIGKERKFYVEAKKPRVDIQYDIHPAYQLKRYAWNAHLPLSILTDFEELAVYNCKSKPNPGDSAATGRDLFYKYTDYVEKWDEIAAIFSKEAVWKGAFDRFAETTKGKKGTTGVDDAILDDIENWRKLLALNIALRNPQVADEHQLNYAVQMTIDRILFLRICEDRGIEPEEQLKSIAKTTGIYPQLVELFRRADLKYNSGLFHFNNEKGNDGAPDTFTPGLKIDDKVLKEIITSIYYPCPYIFKEIPVEILGQVYEQFLGRVVRLTAGHQARIEEKPEVRKAGGVYYTPKYIVDYIVQNTVGKLLEGKTPTEAAELKIVDPACGSGSFLLGAFQYLIDWHEQWYNENEPEKWARGKSPALLPAGGGGWKLTTAKKKEILVNNIHGVDIDAQAVEVTKLSLLLKVLEEESGQLSLGLERALPDLGRNIQCGNSLIGPDYYTGRQMPMFGDEELYRVNPFDWQDAFKQVFAQGGFDAVIGNPPYVRIHRIPHNEADYFYNRYLSPTSKTDLSLIFIEKALNLCNSIGWVGFICTSQWLSTDYGRNLRKILSDGRLNRIIHFGSLPVFKQAQTYPAIFLLTHQKGDILTIKRIKDKSELSLRGIENAYETKVSVFSLNEKSWNLGDFDLPNMLKEKSIPSMSLEGLGGAYIGVLTGMDDAFVVTEEEIHVEGLEPELLLPYAYRGAEINRFSHVTPKSYVIYPYSEKPDGTPQLLTERELKKLYPNIFRHLYLYKSKLQERLDSRKYYAKGDTWYRHLRPGTYKYIESEKLVIKGIDTKTTVGLLGANTAFNGANCPAIILNDKYLNLYVLGILNSKLITYYLQKISPEKLNDYRRYNARSLNTIPIRTVDFTKNNETTLYERIVALVESMITLHRQLAAAHTPHEKDLLQRQIASTDRQIDALVYELYGLTDEEIKIVEGGE